MYAEHAARAKRVHLMTPQQWDAIELKLKQADLFAPQAPESAKEKKEVATVTAKVSTKTPAKTKKKTNDIAALARKLNG